MNSNDTLTTVFTQIVDNTLWATGMGLMLALLWRWLPVWIRYGLGLLVVCRLLLPVLPASPWSVANGWTSPASVPVPTVMVPPVKGPPTPDFSGGLPESNDSTAARPETSTGTPSTWNRQRWARFWLAGAVISGLWLGWRQRAFDRWWKTRRTPAPEAWAVALAACLKRQPFRRPVRLWLVRGLGSPLACGLFRPCILLPAELELMLAAAERTHILRHELAHHRHFDLAWNLVFASAATLHWFNPLVHAGLSRLLREREIRRDADAVLAGAGTEAADYGGTLLKLVTLLPHRTPNATLTSSMLATPHLKQRLTMIPKHTQPTGTAARLVFTAAAAMLAVMTFTRAQDPDPVPAQEPAPSEEKADESLAVSKVQLLTFKMKNIRLPRIQFAGANLNEVVAYLTRKTAEADTLENDPASKGINIVQVGESQVPLTLDLQNVTVFHAVESLCEQAGYLYRLDDGILTLTRKDLVDNTPVARVYRMTTAIASSWGWRPGMKEDFLQVIGLRFGMWFPEGCSAVFNAEGGRLALRLPRHQLSEIELLLDHGWNTQAATSFRLSPEGIRESENPDARILSEPEFKEALKAIFAQNPTSIIRIVGQTDVLGSKLSATLTEVRAAGLANVDCVIRDQAHDGPQ